MSIGINPNIDYQTANSEFLDYYRAKLGYNYQNYQNSSINTSNTTTNKKSQKTENKVIGEDDGHIGIAAVGYAVKVPQKAYGMVLKAALQIPKVSFHSVKHS